MNKSESKYFNTALRFDKALLTLLEKKSFEYITIKEICEEADANRSTFYLHYDNLSDLLKETTAYVLESFASYFAVDAQSISSQFESYNPDELVFIDEKYILPYLTYIKENKKIFMAVLSKPGTFETNTIYQKLFDDIFNPILEKFHYPKEDRHYVMMFYLNGITAIISEWIKEGCEKSMEDIFLVIHYCIFGRK
ncbi:MAG: TetR/AcrR family transcriptional regulator [Oscillospiraceae bacterium]|nr:TetR/AcrR family transcriptional regulator [Oscillospiraceae bacterium]